MITWDLGPRCNYDCSYCPSHRHDSTSKHAKIEELKNGAKFLFKYMGLQASFRNNRDFHISFTGGEPTVNPDFIKFAEYLREQREHYKDEFNVHLTLTTNGAMSKKICQSVIDNFSHVTVSYHCEADDKLKQQVLDRINQFHGNIGMNVNVMLHADYFDECVKISDYLTQKEIKFIPRIIGDEPGSRSAHSQQYTEEHKQWFKDYWQTNSQPIIGRPCCGGRSMKVTNDNETKVVKFLTNRKFENYYCSVNLFFLHLEQQSDSVYHHQTCQATFTGRGPIGKISEGDKIIDNLKQMLDTNTLPTIRCPNTFCGCGLCVPKSDNEQDYFNVINNSINSTVLKR
jgi:organic radical activating enzyme